MPVHIAVSGKENAFNFKTFYFVYGKHFSYFHMRSPVLLPHNSKCDLCLTVTGSPIQFRAAPGGEVKYWF